MIGRALRLSWLWQSIFYLTLVFILYLATTPLDYPVPSSINDKLNHGIAFVTLTLLLRLAHQRLERVWQVVSLAAYGLLIEVIQHFLPWRDFSLLDWLADLTGIAIGLLLIMMTIALFRRYRPE